MISEFTVLLQVTILRRYLRASTA